jgi:uncharacterized membrane protein YhaH (DUF805 family)
MMTFKDSIVSGFKKYFDFDGRASRSEFWWFILFGVIVDFLSKRIDPSGLTSLLALILLIPTISVSVRRLHDMDKSGWWILLSLIPIVNLILLYWFCKRGDPGLNRFGSPSTTGPGTGVQHRYPSP